MTAITDAPRGELPGDADAGAASAPQAAASGFHAPYAIPDTATAVLGVLLAVAVLATAGRTGLPGHNTQGPCVIAGGRPDQPDRNGE
jgi:hypothetical protein